MTDVNIFLRVIQKEGYPNPNLHSIARMVDYDLENFLVDLKEKIGEDGVKDFCDKAIEKISECLVVHAQIIASKYSLFINTSF